MAAPIPGAGAFNERVTIQVKTSTPTGTGGMDESWVNLATLWARTWGASGQEKQIAHMTAGVVSRHFCLRYFPTLTDQHRVLYRGQSYNVTFVNHIKASNESYFDATETDGRDAH